MFKVNNINGDVIDTTSSVSSVLGKACHRAIRAYLGGDKDNPTPADEGEAIKHGHQVGLDFLEAYSDGFVEFSSTIPNRQVLMEKYAFAYFGYVSEFNLKKEVDEILLVETKLEHTVEVDGKKLPVPLKGYPDLVYRDKKGRIIIVDHKFVSAYSNEESVDGEKLIQGAFMFLLVAAELGENPYSIRFREFKRTENRDKSPQTRVYEIVFEETPLLFDLFFRFYEDVTNALLGHQVYVPNLTAMFDKEVAILSYIHRLDVDEERAKEFKKMKVDNITDFLKKKIQKTRSMKKYLDTVSKKFISANTLNYKDMTTEEKIKMKLAEHGLGMEFDSKVEGGSITLYRFEPSVGLKMSKIASYTKDIEQVVEVSGIRILAPIKDSGLIGFEVPKKDRVYPKGKPKNDGFNIVIGEDIGGNPVMMDIRKAPHLLVAGSTGSGKSVWLNSAIYQLKTIESSEIWLLDPKMVELSGITGVKVYADETQEILFQLIRLVNEMNDRYKKLKKLKKKNIEGTGLPYIFVILDEYGDLITQKSEFAKDIRQNILILAQKARSAGIHLIITTQRPSVKIIDGDIKANFPSRIAFKTATSTDSHVILDQVGAEKLRGNGDMLFVGPESSEPQRLQGYNV